jgi:hypothetical protein
VIATLTSGKAADALLGFFNQRSHHLKLEREELLSEQRQLEQALAPLANQHLFNVASFRCESAGFQQIEAAAHAEELQRLLRLLVRKVEWSAEGEHEVQFYLLPNRKSSPKPDSEDNRFDLNRWMPPVGVEPTLPYGNWILSPARLPIPPQRLVL